MSHHRRNTERQIIEEKTLSHLKPSSVINQLKTKVKQKRLSKSESLDLSDTTLNHGENINGDYNNIQRSSQDSIESIHLRSATTTDSHPTTLTTIFSYDGPENEVNGNDQETSETIEQDSLTHTSTTDSNNPSEDVHGRKAPVTQLRPILKPVKATKSLPATSLVQTSKRRRQPVRRTGFQIRDEDFSLIFSDLPSDEQLLIGYSCAWRKDVFLHGRMFLTVNHFCFYTCFFKWEESLRIAYTDIISVTREKSVKLLPNAIKIRTKNQEQYFFTSTLPREKIFITIFRLWQNALLEQPLDYQQLHALIYMDQLQSHDELSGDSEESATLENTPEDAAMSGCYSLPVSFDRSIESSTQPSKLTRRVISLPTDSQRVTYLSSCNCETHLAKTYANRLFTLNVNTLFALLFEDNSFTRNFHNAQKFTDYHYGEWHLNKETGHRERQVTYRTVAQSILGSNTLSCREKQILEVENTNSIYVLSSEVYNEGMKYTDAFYVATRFCMTQRDAEHSSLLATAEVKYVKNVNGFIRTFIEKNAYSSIEGGINEQVRILESQQMNLQSNSKARSTTTRNERESTVLDKSPQQTPDNLPLSSNSNQSTQEEKIIHKRFLYNIALVIGILFLLLHAYLCFKLYSFDQNLSSRDTVCYNQCLRTCSGYGTNG